MEKVTATVDEKDANVLVVGEGDKATRYVKEADLLAVKGSHVAKSEVEAQVTAAKQSTLAEANTKIEAEHQKALQAEARVTSLQEQIRSGGGTAAEVSDLKQKLETAKSSSEVLGNKYLELKRASIVSSYGVPKTTVENKKTLQELELFEEALKAVKGDKSIGNYAAGGGGGGASPLQGKSPMDLARDAYSQSK